MIIVESLSGGKLGPEEQAIVDANQGVENTIVRVPLKHLQRGKFVVPEYGVDVLSGSIDFVHTALKQLGSALPTIESYPDSIKPWLRRTITIGTVRDLTVTSLPAFIKPRFDVKKFTGFVCKEVDDYRLRAVGKKTPLYVVERVDWLTEWRYYCFSPRIFFKGHYAGDSEICPTLEQVEVILAALTEDTPFPTVIDIGVLANGDIAVVEVNDAYSIGLYRSDLRSLYAQLIRERWKSLYKQQSLT